jgi:cytidyltransferase-like protein
MRFGCVHGRFQPFHLGHLEYVLGALQKVDHLIIGITNFYPATDKESPAHRFAQDENPFSFWERHQLIEAAMAGESIERSRFSIVPFPIERPELVQNFVEVDTVMYTTIYDRWNVEKARRLKKQGFDVRVLWRRREKKYEGRKVRESLRADTIEKDKLVPDGTIDLLKRLWLRKMIAPMDGEKQGKPFR